jgi:hypothetical protein
MFSTPDSLKDAGLAAHPARRTVRAYRARP